MRRNYCRERRNYRQERGEEEKKKKSELLLEALQPRGGNTWNTYTY